MILGAVAYLIVSGTLTGQRFFVTVEALMSDAAAGVYAGETVRVSGAVLGETITNTLLVDDATGRETQRIAFTVVHIPDDFENLAEALHIAVNDADAPRMPSSMRGPCLTCSSTRRRPSSPARWATMVCSTPPNCC
ncbi:cytochrome c maturation protein CcmE [bacterium]|nr:cytochrome c maturation protein CcmE [bacterium]